LLLHFGIFFLSETRKTQFNLAMFIIQNNIKIYDELPNKSEIPTLFELPKTASDYVKLFFFKN
jgi:hypothetical protein